MPLRSIVAVPWKKEEKMDRWTERKRAHVYEIVGWKSLGIGFLMDCEDMDFKEEPSLSDIWKSLF